MGRLYPQGSPIGAPGAVVGSIGINSKTFDEVPSVICKRNPIWRAIEEDDSIIDDGSVIQLCSDESRREFCDIAVLDIVGSFEEVGRQSISSS